jgi:hypothetical protein
VGKYGSFLNLIYIKLQGPLQPNKGVFAVAIKLLLWVSNNSSSPPIRALALQLGIIIICELQESLKLVGSEVLLFFSCGVLLFVSCKNH